MNPKIKYIEDKEVFKVWTRPEGLSFDRQQEVLYHNNKTNSLPTESDQTIYKFLKTRSFKLNKVVADTISLHIENGHSLKSACNGVGIIPATLDNWLATGLEEVGQIEEFSHTELTIYAYLYYKVGKALFTCQDKVLSEVNKQIFKEHNFQAMVLKLKAMDGSRWGGTVTTNNIEATQNVVIVYDDDQTAEEWKQKITKGNSETGVAKIINNSEE